MGQGLKLHYSLAPVKKYPETIVFIHNMFGSARSQIKHQHWLNDLGYNTVSFDIAAASKNKTALLYSRRFSFSLGNFSIWQNHMEKVLEDVPGPKIIYAFSGPALSALVASSKRSDIKKVICDGGPFSNIAENTRNLFRPQSGLSYNLGTRLLAVSCSTLWENSALNLLEKSLKTWKPSCPILSIRGMKDPICPPETLKKALDSLPFTPEVLELSEGRHLDGFKKFPDLYKSAVEDFLKNR